MPIHKTTIFHSERGNEFVAKVVEFENYWQQELPEGKIFKFPKKNNCKVEFSEEFQEDKK